MVTGNANKLLVFIEQRLKNNQADVVHDTLSFLVEQMIELNKNKQEHIKNFLTYIEDNLGVKVEDVKRKTIIKEFYKHDFEAFYDDLKANKKIAPRVTAYEFHGNLKKAFENAKNELKPLMAKIEATDRLIDQIVYRLYGLTEDEIKLVEAAEPKH